MLSCKYYNISVICKYRGKVSKYITKQQTNLPEVAKGIAATAQKLPEGV